MHAGLVYTLVFIMFLVVVLAVLVGGIIYLTADDRPRSPGEPAPTTFTTSSSTSTTSPHPTPTSTSTTSTSSSTTTTIGYATLTVSYSPLDLYRLDDTVLSVKSAGSPVTGAFIYVDGIYSGPTADGIYRLLSLPGGVHEVAVAKDGFLNASLTVSVSEDTYATSKGVHTELTAAQRQMAFAQGKASVRVYETAFCSICAAVRGKLDPLVNRNRECIVYEKLSYLKHRDEFGTGSLPFLVVEGSNGQFNANGLVPMSKVKDMVERASGCDVT